MSNSFVWPIDRTLSGATTLCQGGPESYGYEWVLRIPQSSSITGPSSSDFLMSYPGYLLVCVGGVLLLCRDAVCLFYSPSRLVLRVINVFSYLLWSLWYFNLSRVIYILRLVYHVHINVLCVVIYEEFFGTCSYRIEIIFKQLYLSLNSNYPSGTEWTSQWRGITLYPELEPYHQMQFSVLCRTSLFWRRLLVYSKPTDRVVRILSNIS